ncbi:Prefoldin alpha-like [Trinorchestia longiramus]|nr:Prefoldin alpha-like [Trinorchestia longiramus]
MVALMRSIHIVVNLPVSPVPQYSVTGIQTLEKSSLEELVRLFSSSLAHPTLPFPHGCHQALVPLGGAALVPGQLVHTNNVLVLLGDNWFVETTAQKARAIAARRYQDCEQKLKAAEEACKLQSHWVQRAAELQREPGADIVEHVTDDEYKLHAERHREMVKRHRHQLREKQAKSKQSSVTSSERKSEGAADDHAHASRVGGTNNMRAGEHQEEWLKRLEELEEMEKEEDSADVDGSDDSSDSEGDSDSDDDTEDESPETRKTQAEPGGESDEDSEEDLPANLHTFKHVKIESPMPSTERKFQYSGADVSPVGETVESTVEDEVADIAAVGEQIRGRTRSFTRTTDRGVVRCGSQGRDSSNDSRDDPLESKSHSGQRPPVARRVSWADQSSLVSSEEGAISIRYTATPPASVTTTPSTDSTSSSKPSVTSTDSTSSITATATPDSNLDDSVKSSQLESKASPIITSPADLVKLTTASAPNISSKTASENKEVELTATAIVSTAESSSGPKPKSILKKTASQDVIHVPTTKGTSWLQSSESVPITTVYDHEPIVRTSPSPPPHPQIQYYFSILPPAAAMTRLRRGRNPYKLCACNLFSIRCDDSKYHHRGRMFGSRDVPHLRCPDQS